MKNFVFALFLITMISFSVSYQYASAEIYDGTKAGVMLTFEHATSDQFIVIAEHMNDMIGTLSPMSDRVGRDGYITQEQLLYLQERGFEISSHSKTHERLSNSTSASVLYDELVQSKIDLENMGFKINGYVWPYNNLTEEAFEIIKENYLWTTFYDPIEFRTKLMDLKTIEESYQKFGIFHEHSQGVGTGYDLDSFSKVKEEIDYAIANKLLIGLKFHFIDIHERETNTTPALFEEIINYIREKKDLGEIDVLTRTQGLGFDDEISDTPLIFDEKGSIMNEQVKLIAFDRNLEDRFGQSVSISGVNAVVGSYLDDDENGENSGSAYVYTKRYGTWTFQEKITASDANFGDQFGYSVAISDDTIVVGSIQDDDAGNNAGAVYIFKKSGPNWIEQAKLTASDAKEGDQFGRSVAISENTIVVGSYNGNGGGNLAGSAYVFTKNGNNWTQQAKLTASDAAENDQFGVSVAISENTIVVGSYFDEDAGSKSGSAYVFTRNENSWIQEDKLVASDAAADDYFGWDVSISGDTIVVGSLFHDNVYADSGAAYVYTKIGNKWLQQTQLLPSDPGFGNYFGMGVTIDGDTIAVGSMYDDKAGENTGTAYIFTRSDDSWTEQVYLTASDAEFDDRLGWSLVVSGNNVIVSSHLNDDGGPSTGSAYIFDLTSSVP